MTPKIHISEEISNESYAVFAKKLTHLENKSTPKATIEIFSHGGDAYAALAFFDRIKSSPIAITTIGTGLVASAATLILAAGKTRLLTKSAWVMVHEDSPNLEEGRFVHQQERDIAHYRRLEDQWNKLLADVTGTPASTWAEMHCHDTYLTPDECLTWGLITGIQGE